MERPVPPTTCSKAVSCQIARRKETRRSHLPDTSGGLWANQGKEAHWSLRNRAIEYLFQPKKTP
jgi:hypothetical protein